MEQRELLEIYGNMPIPRYTSYPTAPEWGSVDAKAILAKVLETATAGKAISLYVHIPFCQQQCWYCGCNTIIRKQSHHADTYLDYLFREITLMTAHLDKKLRVSQIHFGGGSPNFLSNEQMTRLMEHLKTCFEIDFTGEVAIEIDPRTSTHEQVYFLRSCGFNRLSMGIQDFNKDVQEAINRVQAYEHIASLVKAAREVNFNSINFDLVYGLPRQTVENFQETLRLTAQLKPDRLALYSFAYLPQVKSYMKLIKPETLPNTADKLSLYLAARHYFYEHNYTEIAMDHFALESDELAVAFRTGRLKRNFMGYTVQEMEDSIGFGVSSISYIGDAYFQNDKEIKSYYKAIVDGALPVHKGLILNSDDLYRKWVINELMCSLKVSKRIFKEQFGKNFDCYFSLVKSHLWECFTRGLLTETGDELVVTEKGRLLVRFICSGFDAYLAKNKRTFSTVI
jgi:oxygen-independent coproporphyrinogen III oxidase